MNLGSLPPYVNHVEKHCSMVDSNPLHGSSTRVGTERLLHGHILPENHCRNADNHLPSLGQMFIISMLC